MGMENNRSAIGTDNAIISRMDARHMINEYAENIEWMKCFEECYAYLFNALKVEGYELAPSHAKDSRERAVLSTLKDLRLPEEDQAYLDEYICCRKNAGIIKNAVNQMSNSRYQEIMKEVLKGETTEAVARSFHISERTVKRARSAAVDEILNLDKP